MFNNVSVLVQLFFQFLEAQRLLIWIFKFLFYLQALNAEELLE